MSYSALDTMQNKLPSLTKRAFVFFVCHVRYTWLCLTLKLDGLMDSWI